MLRISLIGLVVFGLQWRFANPLTIGQDAERSAIPWAMAALLPIFGLGAWTYEMTAAGDDRSKADGLWAVFVATLFYLAVVLSKTLG